MCVIYEANNSHSTLNFTDSICNFSGLGGVVQDSGAAAPANTHYRKMATTKRGNHQRAVVTTAVGLHWHGCRHH